MSEGKGRQGFYCSFEAASDDQLIRQDLIAEAMARRALPPEPFDEKAIGVDVARFGDDKSAKYFRHGRNGAPIPYERLSGWDAMQLAARVADWIERWGPDAVFVDDGGVGGGVVDRLRQLGFWIVQGVNFGARSDSPRTGEKAGNKRTEMWLTARAWLETGALPKDDLLASELSAPMFGYSAQNALMLDRKEDMKKRGIPSPDVADAFALTFAYPVVGPGAEDEIDDEDCGATGRDPVTGY